MKSFQHFLAECDLLEAAKAVPAMTPDKLKHLEHAEDHFIAHGDEGIAHAADVLDDIDALLQGKESKAILRTKMDGSPSLVFGINPDNNKFFVATKSAFNKNPKLNYTPQDVEKNHGHAPGLVTKLLAALKYLPKAMPTTGGIYQADLLYDESDLKKQGGRFSFKPNLITYSVPTNTAAGGRVAKSKIGLVVHTKYEGRTMDSMRANFEVDPKTFPHSDDVNYVDNIVKPGVGSYTPDDRKAYRAAMEAASDAYEHIDPETVKKFETHGAFIQTYINSAVKSSNTAGLEGYEDWLRKKSETESAKVKSPAAQARRAGPFNLMLRDVEDRRDDFGRVFAVVTAMQRAKDVLLRAMGNPLEFDHRIDGKAVKPEGFVSVLNGVPTKVVDRAEFSKLNFAGQEKKKEAWKTPVDPTVDLAQKKEMDPTGETFNPVVFAFGRFNPPTSGHAALVDQVRSLAKEYGAKHEIAMSHSQDPEKNPLSVDEKMGFAKKMFPGTNFAAADEKAPDFLRYAARLYEKGHRRLIMVAGSDRAPEYKRLLDKYNGEGPGKLFNFKDIRVESGERKAGLSASDQRKAVSANDFKAFSKGVPEKVSPEDARSMFDAVKNGMTVVIDGKTSGISLARYAKRKDDVGVRARAEQERRARSSKAVSVAKPAPTIPPRSAGRPPPAPRP